MYLLDYECISSAGFGVSAFIEGLHFGRIHSKKVTSSEFNQSIPEGGRVCFIPDQNLKNRNYQQTFATQFKFLAKKIKSRTAQSKVLCIVSSTKGTVEDYIWNSGGSLSVNLNTNPFESVYSIIKDELNNPNLEIFTVSNACSSSHVAIEMAQEFIDNQAYDYVCVIAFDFIGPFIYSGFHALKVLSQTANKPFSGDRDGLQLGEAMAMAVFSKESSSDSKCRVAGCASLIQPSSVTRPSMDGTSLVAVIEKSQIKTKQLPSLFLAHGTGTVFNDLTEDKAFHEFQKKNQINVPITSTKWSIGHCLGASGLMDVIAASEILNSQKIFKIGSLSQPDAQFSNSYASIESALPPQKITSVVVTSLGFGGMYAALSLEALS